MAKDEELPFPDLQQKLAELSTRRYIDVLRNRVNDLNQKLGTQPYLDQYPGKTQPFIFSKLYGPIDLQTPRRSTNPGFESLAPLVNPRQGLLPRNQNILTGRQGSFYWTSVQTTCYVTASYVSDPGFAVPINPIEPGDIFDPVFPRNGGATLFNNFSTQGLTQVGTSVPILGFEMSLYDKKRGRALADGLIPSELLCAGTFGFRHLPIPMRFDEDSEIEARVHVTEARLGTSLDTDQSYDASRVKFYLAISFKGYFSKNESLTRDEIWFKSVSS